MRLQRLNQICAPRFKDGTIPTASLKLDQLEEFGQIRHRIIHKRPFSKSTHDLDNQIQFAVNAGQSVLLLVAAAYDLTSGKNRFSTTLRRGLKMLVLARREFPEMAALIEKKVEERALQMNSNQLGSSVIQRLEAGRDSEPDSK